MIIHTIKVGAMATNCYLVEDEATKKALVIDPGDDADKILKAISENKLIADQILITHGHYDHVEAVIPLKAALRAAVMISQSDLFGGKGADIVQPDIFIKENDRVKVGDLVLTVIECPGHTPGGVSLYSKEEKVIFTGDTLFARTWGRTDLPYSSEEAMKTSLKKLLSLPPDTRVYPGHGRSTTIGEEQGLLAEIE
ncbi:MAG: MBL fold metallo-hydrolase [Candidatus Margulisbacteria bacterium]|nr:MBL fold metallo-hydrolase [Candidatus Margulisiibacteriota bacterium]